MVLVAVCNGVLCHGQNTAVRVFTASAAGCECYAPPGLSRQAHQGQ
jgi:hypothetical protein